MNWITVTIIGLLAFFELPLWTLCEKTYESAYEESEQYEEQPEYQQKNQNYHQQLYQTYQPNHQSDYVQSNNVKYYATASGHQHNNHPEIDEGNEINYGNYQYKEFEYPHADPPPNTLSKLSPPPEPPYDYGWIIKLGFFILGKFLFKILILHKILKFFALFIFLIILPAFYATFGKYAFKGFGRKFSSPQEIQNQRVEKIAEFVQTSIDGFKNAQNCTKSEEEWSCRLNGMFSKVDTKYPVKGLMENLRKTLGLHGLKTNKTETAPTKVEFA